MSGITSVVGHAIQRIYIDPTYTFALTFSSQSNDIWKLSLDGRQLLHIVALESKLADPEYISPIIDPVGQIVAVVYWTGWKPKLSVFALDTGACLRTLDLYGTLDRAPMQYAAGSGRALVATSNKHGPSALVLDIAGERGIEGSVYIPSDLRAISQNDRTKPIFNAVHISDDGNIICAFARGPGFAESMILLRWPGSRLTEDTFPTARSSLPLLIEGDDAKAIQIKTSTLLGEDSFLICAWEELPDYPWGPKTCLSVLHAVNTRTLDISWTVQLWAHVHRVDHVPASGLVLAFGSHNPSTFRDDPDEKPALLVAAIDAQSGALLRLERIEPAAHDASVRILRHSRDAVVIVFENGDLCVTPFSDFLAHGFPRYGDKISVVHPWATEPIEVIHAAMAATSVVVATRDALSVIEI